MANETEVSMNEALQLMLQMAEAIGQKTGKSPVELLVYSAVYALAPQMNREDALAQFSEARANLVKAGLDEKK